MYKPPSGLHWNEFDLWWHFEDKFETSTVKPGGPVNKDPEGA